MAFYYWDDWNEEHATSHGVSKDEAEFVVRHATAPYPEDGGDGKNRAWGATSAGRLIQVVFTFISPDRVNYEQLTYDDILELENDAGPYVYIIHARDLTASEKRQFRKRRH